MKFILTTYRFIGDRAVTHSKTVLTCPRIDALKTLAAMREGLPNGFAVGLTDEQGRNVT